MLRRGGKNRAAVVGFGFEKQARMTPRAGPNSATRWKKPVSSLRKVSNSGGPDFMESIMADPEDNMRFIGIVLSTRKLQLQ